MKNVKHIEIYYHYEMKDWCGDAIDENGEYIENTAEWSATQKLAITRAKFIAPRVPIHVFQKGTEKFKII